MKVKIGKLRVDVLDKKCPTRPCYTLGFDKGSYTPGRGYTSYHKVNGRFIEYPVCMTRHLNGCPSNSICEKCRVVGVEAPGEKCARTWDCDGIMLTMENRPYLQVVIPPGT